MQRLVFYTMVLGFASGVLLRSFLFVPLPVTLLALVIALALLILWYRARARRPAYGLVVLALFLSCAAAGCIRFTGAETNLSNTVLANQAGKTVTLTGLISREPDQRESTTLLTLTTDDTKVLLTTEKSDAVRYGDVVMVTGELELPTTFTTDYGREFNYAGYLAARGITHTMSFVSPMIVETGEGSAFLIWLYEAKEYFLTRLALVLPEPQLGLGAGLLLGVQSALGEELEEAFRVTGIIHIVVLSGYNIMLVVAFVLYALSFFLPWRMRLVVGSLAVVIFALLVGYSPSVQRASLMALIFLLASLLARQYVILRALLAAAALMVFFNPYLLRFDIGFQLSFMATLGLILVAPQFEHLLMRVTDKYDLKTYFTATVATQIAVAPLILYYIGQWSLVAVPVNLIVLPMVPVAMLLTFCTSLVALASTTLAIPLGYAAYLSLTYIIVIAQWFSELPFAAATIPPFPLYLVPIMYIGLSFLYWYVWQRQRFDSARVEQTDTMTASPALAAIQHEVATSWQIVEEADPITTVTKKAAEVSHPAALHETPIFFR